MPECQIVYVARPLRATGARESGPPVVEPPEPLVSTQLTGMLRQLTEIEWIHAGFVRPLVQLSLLLV